jgi:hypothetical protein
VLWRYFANYAIHRPIQIQELPGQRELRMISSIGKHGGIV